METESSIRVTYLSLKVIVFDKQKFYSLLTFEFQLIVKVLVVAVVAVMKVEISIFTYLLNFLFDLNITGI